MVVGLAYEPIPYCSGRQIWLVMWYSTWLSDLFASSFHGQVLEQICWLYPG